MDKLTLCLWFPGNDAGEAARFYADTFPNSAVGETMRASMDYPAGHAGDALTVEFTVLGTSCIGLNGGPEGFTPNESVSFMVTTEDQAETDRYWNALVENGGQEGQCGWCKDRWGFSWQITPRVLMEGMKDTDPAIAGRVMQAMMQMRKIDVAAIEAARTEPEERAG